MPCKPRAEDVCSLELIVGCSGCSRAGDRSAQGRLNSDKGVVRCGKSQDPEHCLDCKPLSGIESMPTMGRPTFEQPLGDVLH